MSKYDSIQIVLVLYKTKLIESHSYNALRRNLGLLDIPYSILLYNNSPEIEITAAYPDETVITSQSNNKLAGAYNEALRIAKQNKHNWLLILDQDTELTESYFAALNKFMSSNDTDEFEVAVPVLKKGEIHLSPIAYNRHLGPFWSRMNKSVNAYNYRDVSKSLIISAFNSATAIKLEAIDKIGGFDTNFPLDMLDHWYFHQLHQIGVRIYVMDAVIEQNLSLLDSKHLMPVSRFEQYLTACRLFAKRLGILCAVSQKIRLCLHIGSQLIHKNKRIYLASSFKSLFTL